MSFVTHEQQSLVWLASPLLGGVRQKMAGTQIYQEVVYNFNMSKASAWAICLLLLSALGLALLRAAEAALVPKADR